MDYFKGYLKRQMTGLDLLIAVAAWNVVGNLIF